MNCFICTNIYDSNPQIAPLIQGCSQNDSNCFPEKTEWIKLKEEGIIHTFMVAGWSGKSSLKRLPFTLAYVIVDGCKTAIANELRGIDSRTQRLN